MKLDKDAARVATLMVGGVYGGMALLYGLVWAWDSLMGRYPLIMVPVTLATCAVFVFVGLWIAVYRGETQDAAARAAREEQDAPSAPR